MTIDRLIVNLMVNLKVNKGQCSILTILDLEIEQCWPSTTVNFQLTNLDLEISGQLGWSLRSTLVNPKVNWLTLKVNDIDHVLLFAILLIFASFFLCGFIQVCTTTTTKLFTCIYSMYTCYAFCIMCKKITRAILLLFICFKIKTQLDKNKNIIFYA